MSPRLKNKKSYLFALSALGAVLAVATGSQRGGAESPQPPSSPAARLTEAESTIENFVRATVRANQRAGKISDWSKSGYLPEDTFKHVQARKSDRAWQALCRALLLLNDRDLALFEPEIKEPHHQAKLECADQLKGRLDAYWQDQEARLESHVREEHRKSGWDDEKDEDFQLPSEEVHVDPSKTPYWPLPKEPFSGVLKFQPYAGLKEKQISITIDDGPHPTYTRQILETLSKHGVRVNFFSVGQNARTWPQLVQQEIQAGHQPGSHSMTHPDLAALYRGDQRKAQQEIVGGRTSVAAAAGTDIPFFRFPYGSFNGDVSDFVRKQGMAQFLWNMDSSDWKIRDASALFENMKRELDHAKGGIMLMHDIHRQTALALPHLLDELRHRRFSTVVFIPH